MARLNGSDLGFCGVVSLFVGVLIGSVSPHHILCSTSSTCLLALSTQLFVVAFGGGRESGLILSALSFLHLTAVVNTCRAVLGSSGGVIVRSFGPMPRDAESFRIKLAMRSPNRAAWFIGAIAMLNLWLEICL